MILEELLTTLILGTYNSSKFQFYALDTDNNGYIDSLKLDFGSANNILIQNYFSNTANNVHQSNYGSGLIESIHFKNIDYHFADIQHILP